MRYPTKKPMRVLMTLPEGHLGVIASGPKVSVDRDRLGQILREYSSCPNTRFSLTDLCSRVLRFGAGDQAVSVIMPPIERQIGINLESLPEEIHFSSKGYPFILTAKGTGILTWYLHVVLPSGEVAPFSYPNVFPDGRICWGTGNPSPTSFRVAWDIFWDSPFTDHLLPENLRTDTQRQTPRVTKSQIHMAFRTLMTDHQAAFLCPKLKWLRRRSDLVERYGPSILDQTEDAGIQVPESRRWAERKVMNLASRNLVVVGRLGKDSLLIRILWHICKKKHPEQEADPRITIPWTWHSFSSFSPSSPNVAYEHTLCLNKLRAHIHVEERMIEIRDAIARESDVDRLDFLALHVSDAERERLRAYDSEEMQDALHSARENLYAKIIWLLGNCYMPTSVPHSSLVSLFPKSIPPSSGDWVKATLSDQEAAIFQRKPLTKMGIWTLLSNSATSALGSGLARGEDDRPFGMEGHYYATLANDLDELVIDRNYNMSGSSCTNAAREYVDSYFNREYIINNLRVDGRFLVASLSALNVNTQDKDTLAAVEIFLDPLIRIVHRTYIYRVRSHSRSDVFGHIKRELHHHIGHLLNEPASNGTLPQRQLEFLTNGWTAGLTPKQSLEGFVVAPYCDTSQNYDGEREADRINRRTSIRFKAGASILAMIPRIPAVPRHLNSVDAVKRAARILEESTWASASANALIVEARRISQGVYAAKTVIGDVFVTNGTKWRSISRFPKAVREQLLALFKEDQHEGS